MDAALERMAEADERVRRVRTVPGIGRVTAARQADVQRELREALAGAKERHNRKVESLRVDQEES